MQDKKEERESLIAKHPKTDQKRAELAKKYGSKLASKRTSSLDVNTPDEV